MWKCSKQQFPLEINFYWEVVMILEAHEENFLTHIMPLIVIDPHNGYIVIRISL